MSYVITTPESLAAASADVFAIGDTVRAASAAAAQRTTGIAAAAGDEVSAAIARLFGSYGQEYQSLSAHTAAANDVFATAFRRTRRPMRAWISAMGRSCNLC